MTARGGWVRWASVAATATLALSLGIATAGAGTTGKLTGVVRDGKKQPLAGANVALPEARLGAVTDNDGRFAIFNVPAGTYTLRVGLIGYATTALTGVSVPADRTEISVTATGTLTLHGQTKDVKIPLKAKLSGNTIVVTGSLEIAFADYGITKPNSFAVLSIADTGTLELQLFFTKA